MPFRWNVQPYRFLTELRDQYTQAVTTATRGKSEQMAKEAKQWMKDNAPWRDRSEEERAYLISKGRLAANAPHAREGLNVFVVSSTNQINPAFADLMAQAKNQDAMTLDEINAVSLRKREAARSREILMKEQGDVAGARALRRATKKQKQYKKQSRVPAGRSAVRALERKKQGFYSPLVDVKFTHDRDLKYTIWLEVANQGRFSIIDRALEYWRPKFMTEIKRIANLNQYRDSLLSAPAVPDQEAEFQRHVAAQTLDRSFEGKGPYEPWNKATMQRRQSRRKYYDPEAVREQRAASREYASRRGMKRTLNQAPAQTFGINVTNTRSSRNK